MAYRIFISVMGLVLAGFGIASLRWTESMFGVPGIALTAPAAFSEIRAFYGGLEIGLAICLFAGLVQRWPQSILLTIVGVCFLCVAAARVGSAAILSDTSTWTLSAAGIEIIVCVIAFFLLLKGRSKS